MTHLGHFQRKKNFDFFFAIFPFLSSLKKFLELRGVYNHFQSSDAQDAAPIEKKKNGKKF